MMILTYVAEIWKELTLTAMIGQIWALPFLVYLYVVDTSLANRWVVFAMTTLLLSFPDGEFCCYLSERIYHIYIYTQTWHETDT